MQISPRISVPAVPLTEQVPYDCGLFYTRSQDHLSQIFSPPAASAPAYLSASANGPMHPDGGEVDGHVQHELVPSPLYVNIENSRRFRALPLFASLLSLGRDGYIGTWSFSKPRSSAAWSDFELMLTRHHQAEH